MKKVLVLLVLMLFSVALIGCNNNSKPETLIIQFVPSTSIDSAKLTLLENLEGMLEEELAAKGYDINVNIGVGTSYASVIEAMVSGQVHVGFLTSQQYAYTTLEFPGKVEVILTSVRNAYEIQIDDDGNEITDKSILIDAANTDGYNASTTSEHKVSSYYSMLLVRTEDYSEYETAGIAALAGKSAAVQSVTSGSGYIYPSFLLYQNDMSFVTGTPNAANGEVKAVTVGGHTSAVLALLNEDVDAVFTFFDARYVSDAYTSWQDANPGVDIFDYTSVVALTSPIYNDTISVVSSLNDGLKTAIQEAFMAIIQTTEGGEALAIYNHTGYMVAVDSAYESERELYQFLQEQE
jgi:phosphonate transport system substrate-binding protein